MTKDGFIRELEECLQGNVSDSQLTETMDYYRSYIDEQTREGETEEEITEGLGSPRLIARSVIDAYGEDGRIVVNEEYVQDDESGESFVRHRRSEGGSNLMQTILGYAILIGIVLIAIIVFNMIFPVIAVAFVVWFVLRMLSNQR